MTLLTLGLGSVAITLFLFSQGLLGLIIRRPSTLKHMFAPIYWLWVIADYLLRYPLEQTREHLKEAAAIEGRVRVSPSQVPAKKAESVLTLPELMKRKLTPEQQIELQAQLAPSKGKDTLGAVNLEKILSLDWVQELEGVNPAQVLDAFIEVGAENPRAFIFTLVRKLLILKEDEGVTKDEKRT